jgi:hypothetical protein
MAVDQHTPEEHALYRFFAEDDSLLYIGISIHPFARMGQHRGDKSWWGEVASTTIERHPDRTSVLAAEREAIQRERPRYNVVYMQSRKVRRPKLWITYTYWEPAVGGTLTIPNVVPMHLGAFYLICSTCGDHHLARDVTDHGGDDFLAVGTCPDCGTSTLKYIPRIHPRGVEHLTEHSPYWLIRQRGGH